MQLLVFTVADWLGAARLWEAAHSAHGRAASERGRSGGGVRRVAKRVVIVMAAAVLWAGAGSALWASPASAGGVDWNSGVLSAAVYNVTPYTWTLVDQKSFNSFGQYVGDLQTVPAATIAPGGASGFGIGSNAYLVCIAGPAGLWWYGYDAYFTYRVDVLGGPPEYVTVGISQLESNGCQYSAQHARADVYITSAPPGPGWHPALLTPPAPAPANQQLTYAHNVPQLFDQTIGVAGNWTVDAQSPLGRAFDDALNTICGASNPNCSFTQTDPLTWGIGAPVKAGQSVLCAASGAPPGYVSVDYTATQQASLSVGGSVTASTEAKLFGIIGTKISVKVEAEHEWTETNSFTRSALAFLPANNIAMIWVAPTIGTVKGTLVLRTGSATFTVTDFTQTRSGVTRDDLTPAYDVITQIRPMTSAELQTFCGTASSSRATSARAAASRITWSKPALFPGRGVERVRLGQPRNARRLGRPLIKSARANNSATANDCRVLDPRCSMVAGRGGTWVYDDLSVVFGADRRVSALTYSGHGRTAEGVGVGSSVRAVRAAYRGASCVSYARQTDCALAGTYRSKPVKTVFHFTKRKGRLKCDRVLVYLVDPRRAEVGA